MTRRLAACAAALLLLTGCAWKPLPRPDPPPAGLPPLPVLKPVHEDLREACDVVQPDGSVTCSAEMLRAVDKNASTLYHDGRQSQAVAISERRHRQIAGEAAQVALDERDAELASRQWDFWRGFVYGALGAAATAGALWGGWKLRQAIE